MIVIDDHLVRDLAAAELPPGLAWAPEELATTNLWVFRLASALAHRGVGGSLSGPVKGLGQQELDRFRHQLAEELAPVTVVAMRDLAWSMADLQHRHGQAGRALSAAMAEALAAAHFLGAGIAVAADDVGPGLRAAAAADGIAFHVVER